MPLHGNHCEVMNALLSHPNMRLCLQVLRKVCEICGYHVGPSAEFLGLLAIKVCVLQ
jgi:hypothetical protein